MEMIINIIGYIILFMVIDYKRSPEDTIKAFTIDWVLITFLVGIGAMLSQYKL